MTTPIRSLRAAAVPLAALAVLLLPPPAASQQAESLPRLHGVVVDAESGTPLPGAVVRVGDRRAVIAGAQGRFDFGELPRGSYQVRADQLGYDSLRLVVAHGEGEPLRLALQADPVVLQGIQVVADRFRTRRNAVAASVRAFERSQLLGTAAPDALAFVSERTGLTPIPCPGRLLTVDCAWVRGRQEQVRVYIDDAPTAGGLDHLRMYQPHELYLVEVFSGGRQIRAYTNWYVELAGRGRVTPPFILF